MCFFECRFWITVQTARRLKASGILRFFVERHLVVFALIFSCSLSQCKKRGKGRGGAGTTFSLLRFELLSCVPPPFPLVCACLLDFPFSGEDVVLTILRWPLKSSKPLISLPTLLGSRHAGTWFGGGRFFYYRERPANLILIKMLVHIFLRHSVGREPSL